MIDVQVGSYLRENDIKRMGGTLAHSHLREKIVTPLEPRAAVSVRTALMAMAYAATSFYRLVFRVVAWFLILAVIVLSVVPASERPVTGTGQWFEHFVTFMLVGVALATGYRLSLMRLLSIGFLFCGGIELLQVPLSTRHARVSDFVIDCLGSWLGIWLIWIGGELFSRGVRSP